MAFARTSISIHLTLNVGVTVSHGLSPEGRPYKTVTLGSWSNETPEVTLFFADGDPLYDVLAAYEEAQKNV